jgi:hypothetical protein
MANLLNDVTREHGRRAPTGGHRPTGKEAILVVDYRTDARDCIPGQEGATLIALQEEKTIQLLPPYRKLTFRNPNVSGVYCHLCVLLLSGV